ncbi:MAG: hypothetical protein UY16_C0007G0026 [Candidatus Gottesmanbacteria bacterium GW2011_GWA2_47_9]|uniref:Uncharacterized protein n=1 Tax=Candidatus Gottesmanbacteria bacterium GW2011_GWA2_47_9 TaxID=1618445 RepID=A0A0G1X1X2_9BACT|nr:MAG: hypothetical protein UY16_C0007G0026 [Candidatus Gottesmanbacteria bacterium GW2011_GWA2_47_9]
MASDHQVAGSTPARRATRARSSMVEQLPLKQSVEGSNPSALTKKEIVIKKNAKILRNKNLNALTGCARICGDPSNEGIKNLHNSRARFHYATFSTDLIYFLQYKI